MLAIVPASLRLVWAEELEKWLPHLRPGQVHVIEGREHRLTQLHKDAVELPAVTITSYEMMKRLSCEACQKGAAVKGGQGAGRGGGASNAPLVCKGPGRQ